MSCECSRAAVASRESAASGWQPAFVRSWLTSTSTAPSTAVSPVGFGVGDEEAFDDGEADGAIPPGAGGSATPGAVADAPAPTNAPGGAEVDVVSRPAADAGWPTVPPNASVPAADATPTAAKATTATTAGCSARRPRRGCLGNAQTSNATGYRDR